MNKIITEDMYRVLREVELFDLRESQIFIDSKRIEYLFTRIYDFLVWFYSKYVDDTFVPNIFISPIKREDKLIASKQEVHQNSTSALFNIDGIKHNVDWSSSFEKLDNYIIKNYENGERYEGQITRGLKHGQGIYTWQDGTVYM